MPTHDAREAKYIALLYDQGAGGHPLPVARMQPAPPLKGLESRQGGGACQPGGVVPKLGVSCSNRDCSRSTELRAYCDPHQGVQGRLQRR